MGIDNLPMQLTEKQALIYGNKKMPIDLKKAGFKTSLFITDNFIRINYGK